MFLRPLVICCLLFLFSQVTYAETISVKGDNVNLRSGPGVSYEIEWAYGNGFPLRVLERKGEWIKVRDFEKDTGWIHASLVSKEPYVIIKAHKDSEKKINIRKGPSTNHTIVGKAYYGVVFKMLEKKSGWARVRHEAGLEGWIKETLLWQK